jgi:hypothetical protein
MTPIEFVKSLAGVAPSIIALQAVGLSKADAVNFRSAFLCLERRTSLTIAEPNDLLTLMKGWDVGKIEVGMIRLFGSPVALARGTQVGVVETDPLIISNTTTEMLVEEEWTNGHILWYVAQSPGKFLDAIVTAAKFLGDRSIGVVDFNDMQATRDVALECMRRAGGDKYSDFYSMLLGAG